MGVTTQGFNRREFFRRVGITAGGILLANTIGSIDEVFAEDPKVVAKDAGVDAVKVDTFVNNGPSELRYDLVWMPEGYTVKEQAKFNKDVDMIVKESEKRKFFKEYGNLFNWHRIWVPSAESFHYPGGNDTLFQVKSGDKVTLGVPNKKKELSAKAKTDLPCILVNTPMSVGYATRDHLIAGTTDQATHELGHAVGNLNDTYFKTNFKGLNTSVDEKNPPWKELIDKKVKGIGVYLCKDPDGKIIPGYFKSEEGESLMENRTLDFNTVEYIGMILGLRKEIGMIASAPAEGVISVKKNAPVGIVLETLASRTYIPSVKAGYASGTPEEMDALASQLRAGKLSADSFADKTKYKPATMTNVKNKATLTDKLGAGSYVVAVVVQDSNPAILLDPDGVTRAQRVYRVDVSDDKLGMK